MGFKRCSIRDLASSFLTVVPETKEESKQLPGIEEYFWDVSNYANLIQSLSDEI